MATIEIPFAIGETLWHASHGSRTEWVTCPECAGTKVLTLILGNGDSVSLDCASCARGYGPPMGKIERRLSGRVPEMVTLGSVDLRGILGKEPTYFEGPTTCGTCLDANELFRTREECQAYCDKVNPSADEEEERRMLHNLTSGREKMAWSVHYWRGKLAALRKEVAFAEARINKCIEKKGESS